MAHTQISYKQRRTKVGYWVQSLKKGEKVILPPGGMMFNEPERLPDQECESMPVVFKRLPFAFDVLNHERGDDIRKILSFSLKQQKEEDVPYSSGFVCTVIKDCLNAIGVPCSLVMGYREIGEDTNTHMWLNVDNYIVDHTYEKHMTKHQIHFLETSTPNCYKQAHSFLYREKDMISKDRKDFALICMKKGVEIFLTEPNKGIALGLNQEPLYLYYFAMIRYMLGTFGVTLRCLDPSVRHFCWGCGRFPAHSRELLSDILPEGFMEVGEDADDMLTRKFKHCNQCMVSNYCSVACQKKDWEEQHRYLCVSRVAGPASDY